MPLSTDDSEDKYPFIYFERLINRIDKSAESLTEDDKRSIIRKFLRYGSLPAYVCSFLVYVVLRHEIFEFPDRIEYLFEDKGGLKLIATCALVIGFAIAFAVFYLHTRIYGIRLIWKKNALIEYMDDGYNRNHFFFILSIIVFEAVILGIKTIGAG